MTNVRIHDIHDMNATKRSFGGAVLTFLLSAGSFACDAENQSNDQERIVHCDLSDPGCAANPELTAAIEVVRSMGIDPDHERVELWVSDSSDSVEVGSEARETVPESRNDEDRDARTTASPEDSISIPIDVQEQRMACAGEDPGCHCCCYAGWGAIPGYYPGDWGCECEGCW